MKRKVMSIAVALAALLGGGTVAAGPADEAKAIGREASAAIKGGLSEAPARELTPGYTNNPQESGLAPGGLSGAGEQRYLNCLQRRDDPGCDAVLQGRDDAERRRTAPSLKDDPIVRNAVDSTRNPVLDGIARGYSDCREETKDAGVVETDTQYCHKYYLRVLDRPCTKTLNVTVDWHCAAGATGPHGSADSGYYCQRIEMRYTTDLNGNPYAYPVTITEAAIPTVFDSWNNSCAGMEARVPPCLLPADDESELPPAGGGNCSTGKPDKCEQKSSVCTDRGKKTINGLVVERKCWNYLKTFNCVDLDSKSDCDQPRFGQCSPEGAAYCVDWDQFDPGFCTAEKQDFTCVVRDTRRKENVVNCSGRTFTDREGNVWDTGYAPDEDFGSAVAYLEAGREAGMYLTKDTLEIFKGFDNRCVKKLFGIVNCCNKAGGFNAGMFNTMSVAMGTGAELGKAAFSTYTYDALFASDAPGWAIKGFESLFGTGFESSLAGMFAGSLTFESFLMTLMPPSYWSIAMMIIQYSGLLSCEEKEKIVAIKRDASLCVDLGTYCSKKLPIIRTCIERTNSFCCFNSKLAKLVNVQGKSQIGLPGLGSAQSPNCRGFTPEELQRLDLSAMDLAEFIDDIKPDKIDFDAPAGRIDPEKCYYGDGKC